jgi:signal recognition particle receptor subunit beta
MAQHKIIFSGPVGAGKTTAISTISDTPPISTEARARDNSTRAIKEHTTVAMDYGVIQLSENEKVHLYGTPGQSRFDFMWKILSEGALGVILLIENNDPHAADNLINFMEAFTQFVQDSQLVVGITKTDVERKSRLEEFNKVLEQHKFRAPIIEVDARNNTDVTLLVQALLYSIDPGLNRAGADILD